MKEEPLLGAAQLLEANPEHVCNLGMTQPANHFLTAGSSIMSTQEIGILGKAEAGGLPPALAQGGKTSEYLPKGWRENIEQVG